MTDSYPAPLDPAALAATWDAAWLSLGRRPAAGLRTDLMNAWAEPERHYHDLRHLGECLALWERWQCHSQHRGEVAIALWFHDAVYDPRAAEPGSNELSSAAWAARSLAAAGVDSDDVQRVHDLIMATQHGAPAAASPHGDGPLLVDIDLAILGSPPERFERYDRDVRREYGWVSGLRYMTARMQVLAGFESRPQLYQTPAAVALLERQARINLAAALSRLEQ